MNQQPTFDPRRSAAIRSMLMETVESTPSPQSRPRKRTLVAIILAVVAAVLASGTIALALGGQSPFDWSASTPTSSATPSPSQTPEPTPTPTPSSTPVQSAVPQSVIPTDCAALLPEGTLQGSMAGATLGVDSVEPFTPQDALVLQNGVLQCQWSGDFQAEGGLLNVYVSTDAPAGTADIEAMIAAGAQSLAVGDSSALSCAGNGYCDASIVIGSYWVEYTLQQSSLLPVDESVATMEQAAASFVSALRQHPTPLPAWIPPASPWISTADCSTLSPDAPMSEILGSSEIAGPIVPSTGTTPSLVQNAQTGIVCRWSVPDGFIATEGQIRSLEVQIAPGTAWVADDDVFATAESTPMDVEGADAAYLRCVYSEGQLCWLDVFVDNSWMQLGYADYTSPENAPLLQSAAEEIIATRHR